REGAAPTGTTMRVRQRAEVEFAVWLTALDRFADDAAALNALATLRALPRQALLGWGVAEDITDSPITFGTGEMRTARPGRLAWRDTFSTALYYQQS
ncbi:phage tail terminator protein, partial [Zavarzinia sp.]|uniref:phage tail terminator protein n=1 Tax=Zavarzinia sp. TaxID=2027920 RepID=UPI003BB5FB21